MPGKRPVSRSVRRTSSTTGSSAVTRGRMLLIVDNRPLQRAAWAEFHAARKRLEKASSELHRHEEVDQPAYESWIHRTFPTLITMLRQLGEEVFLKGQQVHTVQAMSHVTGRSLKRLWQEFKDGAANPKTFQDEPPEKEEDKDGFFEDDDEEEDDWGGLFDDEERNSDEGDASSQKSGHSNRQSFDRNGSPRSSSDKSQAAKDIYRRLVQRLHPDRGGAWTAARERLWHQVQQAWATADLDWLIRLEVEWESANDVLGPTSPLGRLRIAIQELHAARRDIERKLRDYRGSFAWRFTLSEKNRHLLHERTEENFRHDIRFLQRQLDYLNATIAAWERPRSVKNAKASRGNREGARAARAPRHR